MEKGREEDAREAIVKLFGKDIDILHTSKISPRKFTEWVLVYEVAVRKESQISEYRVQIRDIE